MLAAIALGSNLGDRAEALRRAADALPALGTVVARSRIYETVPVGPPQPAYLNAVVLLDTELPARALLERLLDIERSLGRVRAERWGPRIIDLDLLAAGDLVLDEPGLTLPHPQAHRRAFVLAPLAEIAADLWLPGVGRVGDLLAQLPASDRAGVRPTALSWTVA